MINLKKVGIALMGAVVTYIFLFLMNRPDYYTTNDVSKRKQQEEAFFAQTREKATPEETKRFLARLKKSGYETFKDEHLPHNDTKTQDITPSFISSRKSKYFNSPLNETGLEEITLNEIAERNFEKDLNLKSFSVFILLSTILIVGRYAVKSFTWLSRTSKLS